MFNISDSSKSSSSISSSISIASSSTLSGLNCFNPDDVEGDAIESDDEMEDGDLDE